MWNKNLHHSTNRELILYTAQALPLALKLQRSHAYDLCFAWSSVPAGAVALALQRLNGLPYLVWASGPRHPRLRAALQEDLPTATADAQSDLAARNSTGSEMRQKEIEMIQAADPRAAVTYVPNRVEVSGASSPARQFPTLGRCG